jgi:predicted metal-dependent peptidase
MFDPKAKLSPEVVAEAEKRFEWLITFLICRFGFVHQILMMMDKVADPRVGTASVCVLESGRFQLSYSPAFFYELKQPEAVYVFYHEVLHLALHHCTTRKFDDHQRGNVAHDLAVSELIDEISGTCEKPRDIAGKPIGWHVEELLKNKDFKDIQRKQSSEWYYDYLEKKEKEGKVKRIPMPGCGGMGGGKPDDKDDGKGDEKGLDIPGSKMDDHGGWKENELADEAIKEKVKEIYNNGKSWGTVSDGAKEIIMAAQERKINWRNKIRVFFGNLAWRDKENTRKRPNRRTGFIHPGSKRLHIDRYLVAVDTSGSIDSKLLTEFLGVMNGLVDFIPIDIMQFDWEKQSEPVAYDRHRQQFEFKGRGGTSFQPVMDTVSKFRYKGVVILTDGEAAAPTPPTNNARILWVMPEGHQPPVDWGDRIHMTRHA